MKVIHLSVECYPVAKVGGLGDVVGSLPKYQRILGVDSSVVMPWFDRQFTREHKFRVIEEGSFYQGSELLSYTVYREEKDTLGFPLYLIKIPGKLDRSEVYCYEDEAEQWIAFQHAFICWVNNMSDKPGIVHCHDHHVGLIPFLTRYANGFADLNSIKTVVTVHNGQYQGWMGWNKAILLPAFDTWKWGLLDWGGMINPLATAIKCCDAYTTVSEGYLKELYQDANGLQDLFRDESGKSFGIVNGIDTAYWNPEQDPLIAVNYSSRNIQQGKRENKKLFCGKYGLPEDLVLLSYIGRFAKEKGADYLTEIIRRLLTENKRKIAIFILGSGDVLIEQEIVALREEFPDCLAVFIGYNETLAHEVYAASDMLIMPSKVEPCGLNQFYALKYGTIPIVRGIGGLKDTVIDINEKDGYGIVFDDLNSKEAVHAIDRALELYEDGDRWQKTRTKAMSLDFSWDKSAQKYIDLYHQLLK